MKRKQAQGLSLQMVLIGIISVVTLVIIILIFLNPWPKWNHNVESTVQNCTQISKTCHWAQKCTADEKIIRNAADSVNHYESLCCCAK